MCLFGFNVDASFSFVFFVLYEKLKLLKYKEIIFL